MAAGFESNSNSKPSTSKTRKQRMSMAPRMAGSTDRRSSLAPPLASTTNASNRRKSMGVGEHRHSSIPPPTTMRTDPRTISDKAYFNQCVRRLHRYLDQNGYEHPMKLKDLSRPSAKDFHNFMTFLLRKVDPSFNTSPKRKFEDDVVVAFKVIGYPFNISKTALVAAGSPHTWPTLLLSITWLIEVLEGGPGLDTLEDDLEGIDSVGEAGQPFESIEKLEARTEQAFLKYVEISYGSFLSGDDAHFEKLELEFLDYNEKDSMVIEQTIERVMDENVAAENEYAEFCKEGGE
jgi:kinetochore protein NDC80